MMSNIDISGISAEEIKTQIKRIKKELKVWEQEFAKVNGRKPEKRDISQVPEIAIRYKLYSKLKKEDERLEKEEPMSPTSPTSPTTLKASMIPKEQVLAVVGLPPTDSKPSVETMETSGDVRKDENELPDLPTKATYRSNILAGPLAKSDVGQNLNRFAMRAQQQQQAKQEDTSVVTGIISYSSVNEPMRDSGSLSNAGSEVKQFFSRKQELEVITTVESNPQVSSQPEITPVVELQPKPIINANPTIISIGKSVDSINNLPLADPTQQKPTLPDKKTSKEELEKSNSEVDLREKKKRSSKSSTGKSSDRLSTKSRSSQEQVPQSPTTGEENPLHLQEEVKNSGDALSPVGDVIVPTEDAITPAVTSPSNDTKKDNVKNLPSLPITNLFVRVPKDIGILRCKLVRKKNFMGKGQPTYYLYNELDNSFLLAARRILMSKSINYVISDHQEDISKDSPHYVAKLKANFMRTHFTLTDTRSPVRHRELACVSYSKNVLPRELQVAISAVEVPEDATTGYTNDIQFDFKAKNEKLLLFLKNKQPRWNEATQSHCLNFGGRVTQPSIKNMQLICEKIGGGNLNSLDNYNVLQFGRCGSDYFTLDVRWPMTPIEAFGIAITTFDAYDSA